MAKPQALEGVTPDTPVGQAMSAVLIPKAQAVLSYEAKVRAGDVDGLHDMRVATKRLREAARLFRPAFGRRRLDRHLEHLERLNDALGVGRELDVLGLQLQDLGGRRDGLAAGLQPLVEKLATERRDKDGSLAATLNATLPFLSADFDRLVHDRTEAHALVWEMPLVKLGREAVASRAKKAFALEKEACEPTKLCEFHRMRIAVKKLKYALEVFLDLFGKRVREAYEPIADLQEVMGLVHDCDVLVGVLETSRADPLTPEVADEALLLARTDRATLHTQTLALLASMHEQGLPKRLRGLKD
jgi:CHAD domain-containing protein